MQSYPAQPSHKVSDESNIDVSRWHETQRLGVGCDTTDQ
jgi:hypothetical protein